MKQKINIRSNLAAFMALAALGLVPAVRAQNSPAPAPGMPAAVEPGATVSNSSETADLGLIGQKYYGLEFGYTHHVDGVPNVLHRYGFAANNPLVPGYDVGLKYDWTEGGTMSLHLRQQELSVPLTAYYYHGRVRPFIEGEAGWVWQQAAGGSNNSFAYLLGAGLELQVNPLLVVTPTVAYQDFPHLYDRVWKYGAKATYRFRREWSGSFGLKLDEHQNLEYAVGLNWYF